jgi:hypothetical protein
MQIVNPNLRAYREHGFDKVQGWCNPQVFHTVDLFDEAPINKSGGVCEIGVHHGKLYLLLNQVTAPTAMSFAIDLFDQQRLNIDHSGSGNREIFERNLADFDVHKGANTHIIAGDSTDSKLQLNKRIEPGSLRFFSIDGGHSVEHTIRDLETANELICNEGVVILDDILNHHWLGVIEGLTRFLATRPTLIPFAIGCNKLYLAKLSYQKFYFDLLARSPLNSKIVMFFGHTLVAL